MKIKITLAVLAFVVSFGCANRNANQTQTTPKKSYKFVPESWTDNKAILDKIYRESPEDRYNWQYPGSGIYYTAGGIFYSNYDAVDIRLEPIKNNKNVFPINSMLPVIKSTESMALLSKANKKRLIPLISSERELDSYYEKHTFAIYGRVLIYDDLESYIIVAEYPPNDDIMRSVDSYLINIKDGRLLSKLPLTSYWNTGLGGHNKVSFHLLDGIIINQSVSWNDMIDEMRDDFNEIDVTVFKVENTGFIKMLGPDDVQKNENK